MLLGKLLQLLVAQFLLGRADQLLGRWLALVLPEDLGVRLGAAQLVSKRLLGQAAAVRSSGHALQVGISLVVVREQVDSVDGKSVLQLLAIQTVACLRVHELFDADLDLGDSGTVARGTPGRHESLLVTRLDLLDLGEVADVGPLSFRH